MKFRFERGGFRNQNMDDMYVKAEYVHMIVIAIQMLTSSLFTRSQTTPLISYVENLCGKEHKHIICSSPFFSPGSYIDY